MQMQSIGGVDTASLLSSIAFEGKTTNSPKTMSFDKMLQGSTEAKSKAEPVKTTFQDKNKGSSTKVSKDNTKIAPKDNTTVVNNEATKVPVAKESNTSDTNSVTSQTEKQDLTNQTDSITKAVEEVKETILKTLSITEEELTEFMSILGISMLDLLNPESLKQLTLASAGTEDITILLTDENLNQSLNQLLDSLDQIMDQCGIKQEDVLALQNMEKEFATILGQSEDDMNTEKPVEGISNNNVKVQEQRDDVDSKEETSVNFEFTAVKHSDEGITKQSTDSQKKDQTPEKQITSGEQFLNQLTQTVTTRTDFSDELTTVQELRDITNQIVEQIKVVIKPSQTSMDMMLNPEHLGRVQLNISSKEGVLTASFITQNQVAKEAIESQIQVLKENLEAQGLKVEEIEVTIANFSFQQSSQMNGENKNSEQGKAKTNKALRLDSLEDIPVEEEENENLNVLSGSNFDTSA
ncbi:flagellar hook-length control protein FliK [Lachnoclostridium phytofermentans]|uniref:Flagellar hook-length control protein n=1 Tax=Lachnoclostridium phytofermentans (strain ATCC 700394 / DSM 18823 / ISDg) TaxID=357809 RepID=A9KNF5_LACP7|nr:flagellar hook-length control protein FliK [Lachnoclostridium phytofermentans]ABX43072.1 flagellar hook-length control protein [Lachnoclostridium phytofermentans ISDg]